LAASSRAAMHAWASNQACYLPILAPTPSLIPSPNRTTGWTSVHAVDRLRLRSSRRPAPSTTGRRLVPGSRTISTRIVPSPPGQQHAKTAILPLRIDRRSRRAGGFLWDRQPLKEYDTLIGSFHRMFFTESAGLGGSPGPPSERCPPAGRGRPSPLPWSRRASGPQVAYFGGRSDRPAGVRAGDRRHHLCPGPWFQPLDVQKKARVSATGRPAPGPPGRA
jgi:hypothetical protein